MPSITLGQLEWICEIVREYVPGVSDDADQLEPRARVLGIFCGSGHDLQELVDFENPVLDRHDVFLLVLLVLLCESCLELLGLLAVLLKSLLVLGEIDLQDVVEDTALGRHAQLGPLGRGRDHLQELADAL